ncbi:GDP-L-fucose synthase family protein [Methylomagnum ishizawai]|uniref:GDP-L-fucose synthase family protein n=1 Tax=Methylomagnum ishizawai TaxID=1760988 RepID=UPI001C326004|nr:GDP-L-fucose synthase [Methylomagnum ishizawai]BBL74483.1 GDP-L-fucose synthase [Methylomagnum ishizawai]
MDNLDRKIFVAGHRGLVGSAVLRCLERRGYHNLLTRARGEVDLTDYRAVAALFQQEKPEVVIDAAAKVGGILANDSYPADFIRDNLFIQNHLIDCAYRAGVRKFVFLGSSCIYPKAAPQPMREEHLLTGALEPTNEWYAVAKIAGIKMCQAYRRQYGFDAISLMPTNLYGPGDYFDLEKSHVLPALLRKFHEAKQRGDAAVTVWGSGTPRREFLYVDDLAEAVVFLMENYSDPGIVNIGTGEDLSIRELAGMIRAEVGFAGELRFDASKPDGTPRKLLDVSRLSALGWRAATPLAEGIRKTYRWYLGHAADLRV